MKVAIQGVFRRVQATYGLIYDPMHSARLWPGLRRALSSLDQVPGSGAALRRTCRPSTFIFDGIDLLILTIPHCTLYRR